MPAVNDGERTLGWQTFDAIDVRVACEVLELGDIISYTYPGPPVPHHVVIDLGGERISKRRRRGRRGRISGAAPRHVHRGDRHVRQMTER